MGEANPVLRRVERTAIAACVAMTLLAWPIGRWGAAAPLGVLGGGLLAAISYRGIRAGIDAAVGGMVDGEGARGHAAVGLLKFFSRFAILVAAAYVIIARLRLPPLAVIGGASSFVIAVAVEAVRGGTPR